jgi:hypothetical protein
VIRFIQVVTPQELTNDECWTIHKTICVDNGRPDGFTDVVSRDYWIGFIRTMLGCYSVYTLQCLERQLTLAGEHALAGWMKMYCQKRQALN